jgi:hypothetical protein
VDAPDTPDTPDTPDNPAVAGRPFARTVNAQIMLLLATIEDRVVTPTVTLTHAFPIAPVEFELSGFAKVGVRFNRVQFHGEDVLTWHGIDFVQLRTGRVHPPTWCQHYQPKIDEDVYSALLQSAIDEIRPRLGSEKADSLHRAIRELRWVVRRDVDGRLWHWVQGEARMYKDARGREL